MKFAFAPESKPLEGYTIKRAIHRGGFGEVYYALSDAGKEVALKLLRQNMDVELRGVTQCLNLKHPNLVSIFDIKEDSDGDHWIIMEYVAGKTLDEILDEYPSGMPLEKVSKWMEQICLGLNFLHDRGIVHRDMKPANLFIEDDFVKIGDIGLSKFITQSRRSAQTQSVGTVYYMAPEVAHGRYGHEVDVYALGIILYELITGRVPFEGESTGEILMKHLTDKPDLNRLPESFRGLISRALEKDPQKRTSSVNQFWNELQSAMRGDSEAMEIPESSFKPVAGPDMDIDLNAGRRKQPEIEVSLDSPPRSKPAPEPVASQASPTGSPYHKAHKQAEKPFKSSLHSLLDWYNAQPSVTQAVLIFGVLVVVFFSGLLPVVIVLGIGALMVWGFYTFLMALVGEDGTKGASTSSPAPPPVETKTQPLHPVAQTVDQFKHKVKQKVRHWTDKQILKRTPPETVRHISLFQRVTELTSSLSLSVLYIAIFSSLYLFISEGGVAESLPTVFYLGSTTLLIVWSILTVSKLTEGTKISGLYRRCLLIPAALLMGSAAYGLSHYLMVFPDMDFTRQDTIFTEANNKISDVLLIAQNQPTWDGYLCFFLGFFFIRGWWGVSDSYRKKKLSIGTILWSGLVTTIQISIFAFPFELAFFWSVVATTVFQLATVWTPPRDRLYIAEDRS
ncbi:MAG: serine/threonine protein kinase [Planctomycetaceae bacterium]|nr:serine/threonine protein kinase [Planctomycetaceae bacterium]